MRIRNTSDTPNKSLFRATIADTYDVCDTLSINAFILGREITKEREGKMPNKECKLVIVLGANDPSSFDGRWNKR